MERIDARVLLATLVGQEIETMTGRPNRILRVDSETVLVGTNSHRRDSRFRSDGFRMHWIDSLRKVTSRLAWHLLAIGVRS